ncbi:MAG: 2-amino-4-hydroxy-6-hydroxymethyldihydropteridine diphosphokinase [Gammaproteobacteria bacterium]|jgi:2-amino-4-hydroxy-6-hydroxymethyldihydropteridine diphosphokinase
MARVYVSIGSNIDRERHIDSALQTLAGLVGPLECSTVYESAAVGFDSDPFYNLVVGFDTELEPRAVQALLHEIEAGNGRQRSNALAARTLDLDMLLYDDLVVNEPDMVLPRADINAYAFVLAPLAEIAGARRHPVSGRRFDDLWSGFADREQVLKPVAWLPVAGR